MKTIIQIVLALLITSCIGNNGNNIFDFENYQYDELTVNHVRNTQVTTFLKNGEPISGTVTQELRNGRKNIWEVERGLAVKQTMYYENGQIRRSMELKNGVEHGSFLMYYSNGDKFIEQFYDEGEPIGIWNRWNREGEIVETIEH